MVQPTSIICFVFFTLFSTKTKAFTTSSSTPRLSKSAYILNINSFHDNLQIRLHNSQFFIHTSFKSKREKQLFSLPPLLSSFTSNPNNVESIQNKETNERSRHHTVNGIDCVEVSISLNSTIVPYVTILEATASSQEELVNMALRFDDEVDDTDNECESESESEKNVNLNSGDPYGAVLWPAASAIANHLLDSYTKSSSSSSNSSQPLSGLTILELGAGTGLVSVAATMAGASSVIATDYEQIPLMLLRYAVQNLNNHYYSHHENRFKNDQDRNKHYSSIVQTFHLDMCDETRSLPYADIVLAADIMYEPHTGIAMARRTLEALKQNSRVIIGDSPGRPGRPAFLKELERLGLKGDDVQFRKKMGHTCTGDRHDLICGKGSTSVSAQPQDLEVAVMDLKPDMFSLSKKDNYS